MTAAQSCTRPECVVVDCDRRGQDRRCNAAAAAAPRRREPKETSAEQQSGSGGDAICGDDIKTNTLTPPINRGAKNFMPPGGGSR
ncbi:hypothetical protein MRX96_014924 [Rhipicephalus microplus]